jgi:hypothetical protein
MYLFRIYQKVRNIVEPLHDSQIKKNYTELK